MSHCAAGDSAHDPLGLSCQLFDPKRLFFRSAKLPNLIAAYAPAKKPMRLEPIVMIHGGSIPDTTPMSTSQACSTAPPIVPASQKTTQRTRISATCRASFICRFKLNSGIAVVGIDIGKNSFHVVGHDKRGAIVLRQKWSRGQAETRLANLRPCHVRPYSKGQKNDFRDGSDHHHANSFRAAPLCADMIFNYRNDP